METIAPGTIDVPHLLLSTLNDYSLGLPPQPRCACGQPATWLSPDKGPTCDAHTSAKPEGWPPPARPARPLPPPVKVGDRFLRNAHPSYGGYRDANTPLQLFLGVAVAPAGGPGDADAELLAAAQKVIDGDPTDRLNFPGYRAAGVLVRALSPVVVTFPIEATLTYTGSRDQAAVIADVISSVESYVNTLGISGDVIRAEIIDRIMDVDGVYDVALASPSGNVVVLDNQIARVSSGDFTVV